jgi:hypothetical protein
MMGDGGISWSSKRQPTITLSMTKAEYVTTLALGSRPRQGLAKVRAKNEARESHFMFPRMWESVKE